MLNILFNRDTNKCFDKDITKYLYNLQYKYHNKHINKYKTKLINKHEKQAQNLDKYKTKYIKKYILQPLPQVQPLHHSRTDPTLPPRSSHAAPTQQQPALTQPPRPHHAAPCHLHAAPAPLPRRPSAAATQRPRRLHTATTQQQRCCNVIFMPLHAALALPSRPTARSFHAALTPAENASFTLHAHCSHATARPPSRLFPP